MEHFKSAQELMELFGLDALPEYENPTAFSDCISGFSVQRSYPEGYAYRSPMTPNGDPDVVALIKVVYKDPSRFPDSTPENTPLLITISHWSRWTSTHFDYDFEQQDCPTEESINDAKRLKKPIDLNVEDEFFIDHRDLAIYDSKKQKVTGKELLDVVFQTHLDSLHPTKGMRHRRMVRSRHFKHWMRENTIKSLEWILQNIFDRSLGEERDTSSFIHGYKRSDFKRLSTDNLTILGYKTSPKIVFFFCFCAVCGALLHKVHPTAITSYFATIFGLNFLAVVHTIVIMSILDVILPHALFLTLNKAIKSRFST